MSKQINFTIVPDEPDDPAQARREYANFCAVAHTPFDLTLTFCDVRPLSERDIKSRRGSRRPCGAGRRAHRDARSASCPGLIAALQEQTARGAGGAGAGRRRAAELAQGGPLH